MMLENGWLGKMELYMCMCSEEMRHYKNVLAELRDDTDEPENDLDIKEELDIDYELLSYDRIKIDYDYIVSLIQNIVSGMDVDDDEAREKKVAEIREYIREESEDNKKIAELMTEIKKTDFFCDYYKKWIVVYKQGAIRKVTLHIIQELENKDVDLVMRSLSSLS